MRSRLTSSGNLPAVIALVAVAVMGVALFLPYVDYPWTDGIFSYPSTGGLPTAPVFTASLAQGSDASRILATLVVLGVATALYLLGVRRRITGVAAVGASLIAVAIAAIYPTTLVIGPPVIDYGFFVFVVAATVAAIAGLVMVVTSFRGARPAMGTALRPTLT